jgi:hypothetical protein
MKNIHPGLKAFSVTILVLTLVSLAHAQAARTWVSGSATAMDSPNTCTRTAPCATFAYALTQTAAGGEIDALDPGDFGTVVINKAVTIDGTTGAGFASITVPANQQGITITANTTDVVTIRNLSVNGQNANNNRGIFINQGGTVHIENCVVSGNTYVGILDVRTGSVNSVFYLYIKDTVARNNGQVGGITAWVNYGAGANPGVFIIASFTNVRVQDNSFGVLIGPGTYASLDHCNITGNLNSGLLAQGVSGGVEGNSREASIAVKNSVSSNNGLGIGANPFGIVRISGVQVYDNTTGVAASPNAAIISYGNNEIDGNTNNGTLTSTIPQK